MEPHISDAKRRPIIERFFRYVDAHHPSDRFLLKTALLAVFVSLLLTIIVVSQSMSTHIPAKGGELVEGVVGTPRFVNPVLAVTHADRDMGALIYAGIARLGVDGVVVPDMAESITISEDGLVYNIILRSDIFFHDGVAVTSDDVAFTIGRIQDPFIASPLRASWEGVTIEVISEREFNFVLPEPYAPFIENLTVGILPRHIWKDASTEEFPFSQWNSEPIGSGPYRVKDTLRDASGIPESYTLEPHTEYHHDPAKIETLTLKFFPNETDIIEAFNREEIDSVSGLAPASLLKLRYREGSHEVIRSPLPRTFAVFFNQNKSAALRDEGARRALDAAINREDMIANVMSGYAEPLTGPIPPGFGVTIATSTTPAGLPLDTARTILRNSGWVVNSDTGIWEKTIDGVITPLAVSISTSNTSVFESTAEYLEKIWTELGADISIKQFEQSDLTQSIIRPRDYEALLFGTVVGRGLDFYSFWHSSQRNDPGLNVSLYANITTDTILTEARTSASSTVRNTAFLQFAEEIQKETPAVFLYSPDFTYVFPTFVTRASFTGLGESQERFAQVNNWYIDTEFVWPFFTD